MGRIKTSLVKRVSKQLIEKHKQEFSEDFAKNKKVVSKNAIIRSKKLRNIIAGYATRLTKRGDERRPRSRPQVEEGRGPRSGRERRYRDDDDY